VRLDQAARLKALEREHQRFKRIVADQAVDISILREAAEGNYRAVRSGGRPATT
jgi:hypothetical protein